MALAGRLLVMQPVLQLAPTRFSASTISGRSSPARSRRSPLIAVPRLVPASGPVVSLIDSATQSAAEMFASGLQETGRAVIVGEQSAGNTLPSVIMKLPTGALFQYGFANYRTLAGNALEGHGLVPDVSVSLSRRALLRGPDPQMG